MKKDYHGIVWEKIFGFQKKISMEISFNDTKIKANKYKSLILKKISHVIDKGIFLNGPEAKKTINLLQNYYKKKYFLTCASGHDAIILALRCLELKKDDEVIFPVNAYPTAFPIIMSGAKGVPADVDLNGQLEANILKKLITIKTKVIVVVHLYGLVGNLTEIIDLCKKNKIILIEDCAQAFGSRYQGKLVGTFGDFGCFSFYPTKNLSTLGDGGAILIKNKNHYEFIKKALQYGEKYRYQSEFVSGHSRIPEIQAAILNLYLKKINSEISMRKYLAVYYKDQVKKQGLDKHISILTANKRSDSVSHLFVIRSKLRDKLRNFLTKKNIPTLIHYPLPINKIPAFNFLSKADYPNAEILSQQIISLPFHPSLKKTHIKYILNTILDFYKNNYEKN